MVERVVLRRRRRGRRWRRRRRRRRRWFGSNCDFYIVGERTVA